MTKAFTSHGKLETSVLFLVFSRPDTTAQVFEAIRQAKPMRLYVAADGPRENVEGESERVAKVRKIATAVDWPCEIKTLFHEKNLGCKDAPQKAINWFFQNEERGIILEDDCRPHPDFFRYCEFCLNEFANVPSVWHINGNNFAANRSLYGKDNLSFAGLPQVWGWATWADRWNLAEKNIFYLSEEATRQCANWKVSRMAKILKLRHLDQLKRGLETWDYQWQISVLNNFGLAVSPSSNLISNLGDGPDATHTKIDRHRIRLPTESLSDLSYSALNLNQSLTRWYEKKMGLGRWKLILNEIIRRVTGAAKTTVKKVFQRIVFFGVKPVVVSSTGRSGSTMLFNAVSASFIADRFAFLPTILRSYLNRFSSEYLVRISNIENHKAPVLKTHDLFRSDFSNSAKFIFVFGAALESAKSVAHMGEKKGTIWIEEHIYNLVGKGSPDEIFHKDVLNYEAQLKSWGRREGVFVVHYDDLWDKREALGEFLGFDLVLPERRERTQVQLPSNFDEALFDRLDQFEQYLRDRIS